MSAIMGSDEPEPQGRSTPATLAPEPLPAAGSAELAAMGASWVWTKACVIVAALVAGVLAWGIGERTYGYFGPSAKALQSSREFLALNREQRAADQKNTAIAFGTFGAVLGLVFGSAGGGLRRSIPAGATAALMGLLLGGIGGALISYGLTPIFGRFYSDESPSLLLTILVRGGIWAAVGMTAGLALGWGWQGSRGIAGTLIGGLAGGFFGTIAFEVVNALIFPGERNDAVIPSSMQARLLAYLFVTLGAAMGAVLFGHHRSLPASRSLQTNHS